jgi:hypothetical protein
MSAGSIARAVARRSLVRLFSGVYAVGHGSLQVEGRLLAALFYAGPGAALSHTTAGWWWGALDVAPRVVHLSAPVGRAPVAGLRIHDPRKVERVVHNRLPVTPVPRTLLDLAATVTFDDVRRAVAEADHQSVLEPTAVRAVLGPGRPGSAALRRALALHLPELARAASVLEERFLLLVEAAALPMPEVNVGVGRFKVDALWRAEHVIVELDGHRTHAEPAAAERDRQRDLELRRAGFVILRYTWQQVTRQPELVTADLRAELARRRARPR